MRVKDPVCGMQVAPEISAGKSEYKGSTYYFCSVADKETFDKNPEKYIPQVNLRQSKLLFMHILTQIDILNKSLNSGILALGWTTVSSLNRLDRKEQNNGIPKH